MNTKPSGGARRSMQRIYLNEYNIMHDNATYLPLVSGYLHAYARKIPAIRDGYEFAPYLFKTDLPEVILAKIVKPDVTITFHKIKRGLVINKNQIGKKFIEI